MENIAIQDGIDTPVDMLKDIFATVTDFLKDTLGETGYAILNVVLKAQFKVNLDEIEKILDGGDSLDNVAKEVIMLCQKSFLPIDSALSKAGVNLEAKDSFGATNLERMKEGMSPLDKDNNPLGLLKNGETVVVGPLVNQLKDLLSSPEEASKTWKALADKLTA